MPVPRAVGVPHGLVMLLEAASFGLVAVLHLDPDLRIRLLAVTVHSERATGTGITELIVAGVLALGALAVLAGTLRARLSGCLVTGFAIVVVIGQLVSISVGAGPYTIADLGYDIAIMAVLLVSFAVLMNRRRTG